MSTAVTWNNTAYSVPASGELNWASLSNFLIALGQNAQTTNFQKFGMRVATTTPVTVSAVNDCMIATTLSAPAAVTVNLPAGVSGQLFGVVDGTGDAATNNITINPASGLINGASTYVINKNYGGVILVYNGTKWNVVCEFVGAGPITNPLTTTGDMIYASNTATPATLARLGIGASGTVLHGGTIPSYSSIVNADVDAAAAIAFSKLASLTSARLIVGSAGNVPTAVDVTGDVTISNAGVTAIGAGVIVNADVSGSAAITGSKIVTATQSAVGVVTSYAPVAASSVLTTTNADLNLSAQTTSDGYSTYLFSTGSSPRTFTLPPAASHTGRMFTIKKIDTAVGYVIVEGNSSETIDGELTTYVFQDYGSIQIVSNGSNWFTVGQPTMYLLGEARTNTVSGYGSTATKIRTWTNSVVNLGASITYSTTAAGGGLFTINSYGTYAISYTEIFNTTDYFGIGRNAGGTTNVTNLAVANCIAMGYTNGNDLPQTIAVTLQLDPGDVITAHTNGSAAGATASRSRFTITRLV